MKIKTLTDELLEETPVEKRCPNLAVDEDGPYCTSSLMQGSQYAEVRRMVCNASSLQLWCLDKNSCENCICKNPESKH